MKKILAEVKSGEFAREFIDEMVSGGAKFKALCEKDYRHPIEEVQLVNQPQTPAEEEALRRAVQCGRPFGGATWEKQAATRLGLPSTLRPRGRPRKKRGS